MIFFLITLAYTVIFFGFIVFLVPRVHRIKQLAFEEGLSKIKANYDKQLLTSTLEIQEETLQVLARELHDNIGQKIYLSKLYLGILDPDSPNFDQSLKTLDGFLTEASDDLHSLLKNLSMDLIRKGDLRKAICGLVNQLERSALYKISYVEEGRYEELPEQKEVFVFRIFQEAINNILRHAMASMIEIRLSCSSENITLTIRDNGKGFDAMPPDVGPYHALQGNGLRNMIDRAALINATLVINSQPGQGTRIDITVSLTTK